MSPRIRRCDKCGETQEQSGGGIIHGNAETPDTWVCGGCIRTFALEIVGPILDDRGETLERLSSFPKPERPRGRSHRKTVPVVQARTACFAALRDARFSFPAIGQVFGLHHSTVLLALRRIGYNDAPCDGH